MTVDEIKFFARALKKLKLDINEHAILLDRYNKFIISCYSFSVMKMSKRFFKIYNLVEMNEKDRSNLIKFENFLKILKRVFPKCDVENIFNKSFFESKILQLEKKKVELKEYAV